jgi:hypothetical protein
MKYIKFIKDVTIVCDKDQVVSMDDEMSRNLVQQGVAQIVPATDYFTRKPEPRKYPAALFAKLK